MLGRAVKLTCQNSTQMHPTECGKEKGTRAIAWHRPLTSKDWVQNPSKFTWEFAVDYVTMQQTLSPNTFVSPPQYLSTDVLSTHFVYLSPTINNSRDCQSR